MKVEFNSYPNVFGGARAYARSKGPSAMEKVFWKNSLKPYRWGQAPAEPASSLTAAVAVPLRRASCPRTDAS